MGFWNTLGQAAMGGAGALGLGQLFGQQNQPPAQQPPQQQQAPPRQPFFPAFGPQGGGTPMNQWGAGVNPSQFLLGQQMQGFAGFGNQLAGAMGQLGQGMQNAASNARGQQVQDYLLGLQGQQQQWQQGYLNNALAARTGLGNRLISALGAGVPSMPTSFGSGGVGGSLGSGVHTGIDTTPGSVWSPTIAQGVQGRMQTLANQMAPAASPGAPQPAPTIPGAPVAGYGTPQAPPLTGQPGAANAAINSQFHQALANGLARGYSGVSRAGTAAEAGQQLNSQSDQAGANNGMWGLLSRMYGTNLNANLGQKGLLMNTYNKFVG